MNPEFFIAPYGAALKGANVGRTKPNANKG
jgi:hypothetical protein